MNAPVDIPRPRAGGERRHHAAVAVAAVLWGTAGVCGQLLGDRTELDPVAIGFLRLGVAAVALLALRLRGDRTAPPRSQDLPGIAVVGIGLAAYQFCYFAAVSAAGVAVATLVTLGLAPVLIAVGDSVVSGIRHGRTVVSALATALVGLALLVGSPSTTGEAPMLGVVLATGSALAYALVTLASRSLTRRIDTLTITTAGFVVGALALAPFAMDRGVSFEPSATSLALVAYLGLVPTALAYRLFFAGMATTAPVVAGVTTLLEPLTATALAAAVLGDRLGPLGLVAAGCCSPR